jgi:hypothetical protein
MLTPLDKYSPFTHSFQPTKRQSHDISIFNSWDQCFIKNREFGSSPNGRLIISTAES